MFAMIGMKSVALGTFATLLIGEHKPVYHNEASMK